MSESITGLRAVGVDHIVLRVGDVERSATFYCDYLGAVREQEDLWRDGRRNFLSLRIGDALIDLTPADEPGAIGTRGVAHICVAVAGSGPEETREIFSADGVLVENSVSQDRLGARGAGPSLYVTDPDGYRIELKWYEP